MCTSASKKERKSESERCECALASRRKNLSFLDKQNAFRLCFLFSSFAAAAACCLYLLVVASLVLIICLFSERKHMRSMCLYMFIEHFSVSIVDCFCIHAVACRTFPWHFFSIWQTSNTKLFALSSDSSASVLFCFSLFLIANGKIRLLRSNYEINHVKNFVHKNQAFPLTNTTERDIRRQECVSV